MGLFQVVEEQYSVEEISYEDMISILDAQKHGHDLPGVKETHECQEQHSEENTIKQMTDTAKMTKADEISRRIAENANKKLPVWLLNH